MDTDKEMKDKLRKCKTKGDVLKFLFQFELETEMHEALPGRKEHLQEIMNKILEVCPDIDWKQPL
ncbi:MAG: hypothetical protein ACLFM7_13810 [Bacteroidales bacterium]